MGIKLITITELHTVKQALDELMGALLLLEEEDEEGMFDLVENLMISLKEMHSDATLILTSVSQSEDVDIDSLKGS